MKQILLTALFVLFSNAGISQTTDGLVAYYPFDGNAFDESGLENHATVDGASLAPDRFGNLDSAYEFDGIDDLIKAPDSDILTFQNDYTVSVWALTTEVKSQYLLRKGIALNAPNTMPYQILLNSVGETVFSSYTSEGIFWASDPDHYIINEWQLFTGVRQGDELKLYVNGNLIKTSAVSGSMLNEDGELLIGSRLQSEADTFKGRLDDVRVYNRALAPNEIFDLFSENRDASLVAYYPFNGNANDESVFGNDATIDGPVLTEDRFGSSEGAYFFDGTDDGIYAANAPQLFLNETFTLSAWVRPQGIKTQNIIIKGSGTTGPETRPYSLGLSADHHSVFNVSTEDGTLFQAKYEGYSINEWFLLTGVRDNESLKLYVNGDLVAEESISGELLHVGSGLILGTRLGLPADTFSGKMDEVRIYNRALSAADIMDLANDIPENTNLVEGNIRYDFDIDGCDATDYSTSEILLNITDANGNTYTTNTNENGDYRFILDTMGAFTLEVAQSSLLNGFEATPAEVILNFSDFGNEVTQDFCILSTTPISDISIRMFPINDARPGFSSKYQLIYDNIGTTAQEGTVVLTYEDESRHSFVNSIPAATEVNGNTIIWDYSDLLPFESRSIQVTFINQPPPTNEAGDILVFDAAINPIDDNPTNNLYHFEQEMVNSQDPNDKLVAQGSEIAISEVGDYLDYVVRFQNIGTASAIHVRVEDIFSDNLDWDSFKMLSSSHPYRLEITDHNEAVFYFDDINLPPVVVDPEGSNGFVAFQLKTKNDLQQGDFIENEANIFFDFNAPILTNKVVTTVVPNLGVLENSLGTSMQLVPNPVSEILTVSLSPSVQFVNVEVFSISGQLLRVSNSKQINMTDLATGIYFVKVNTAQGSVTKRIIKE